MFTRIKQLFCRHSYIVQKWHFTHGLVGNEPSYIEGYDICRKCGKFRYFTVERGSERERYIMDYMKERQE